jgi:hypothetical protein
MGSRKPRLFFLATREVALGEGRSDVRRRNRADLGTTQGDPLPATDATPGTGSLRSGTGHGGLRQWRRGRNPSLAAWVRSCSSLVVGAGWRDGGEGKRCTTNDAKKKHFHLSNLEDCSTNISGLSKRSHRIPLVAPARGFTMTSRPGGQIARIRLYTDTNERSLE